jgi:hypothetical protein
MLKITRKKGIEAHETMKGVRNLVTRVTLTTIKTKKEFTRKKISKI